MGFAACNSVKKDRAYAERLIKKLDNSNARIIVGHAAKAPSPAPKGRWEVFAKLSKQAIDSGTYESYKKLGDEMVKIGTEGDRSMAYYIKRGKIWYYVDKNNPKGTAIGRSNYPTTEKRVA